MKRAAIVAVLAFASGACGGTEEWSFDEVAAFAVADASGGDTSNGGCSSDADCLIPSLHCDPMSRQCVECINGTQCRRGRLCDPTLQRCVECIRDGECPAGSACQPTTHECVPTCINNRDCPTQLPWCSQRGICVGCLGNQDCAGPGPMQGLGLCDPTIGQCAECTSSLQCPRQQVCDPTTDRCVGCLTNLDCLPNEVCDPDRRACFGPSDASFFSAGDSTDEFTAH